MTPTERRLAVANAFREIARRFEDAPLSAMWGEFTTADDMLASFNEGEPFIVVRNRGVDERYSHCTVCDDEAHRADCPVRTLEALWGIVWHDKIAPEEGIATSWNP